MKKLLTEPGPERDEAEPDWNAYRLRAAAPNRRINIAGMCALSRRLMAMERARALGRKPLDLRAYALEQEAKRWTEARAMRD